MRSDKRISKPLADCVLIAALVALALIAYLILNAGKSEGKTVIIRENGEVFGEYPISDDMEIEVDGLLTVVIEGGGVYVKNVVCPDKLCERRGRISRGGEAIVCLPSGVSVEISGEDYDFVL